MFKKIIFLVVFCFSLLSCSHERRQIINSTNRNIPIFQKENRWYLRHVAISHRSRPYLLYRVDSSSNKHYDNSLRYRFSLLKGKDRVFYNPIQLSKQLNALGYKTKIEVKKLLIYSKPEGTAIKGIDLATQNKNSNALEQGYNVDSLCLIYEIPNMTPSRYGEDCFMSSSTIGNAGLLVKKEND